MQEQFTSATSSITISTIYALLDGDGNTRYVGITKWSLPKRLSQHIQAANRGDKSHRSKWIRSLLAPPIIVEIEQTPDRSREVYWIAHYRGQGCHLTNSTDGGEGMVGYCPSPETRAKMSHSQRTTLKHKGGNYAGSKLSAEHVAAISAGLKGRKHSDERIAKNRACHLGKKASPEARANMADCQRGRTHSEETKAKISAANKGRGISAETRGRMSEAQRGRKHSAETRAKMRETAIQRKAHLHFKTTDDRDRMIDAIFADKGIA